MAKSKLLAGVMIAALLPAVSALPVAMANTNAQSKLYFCSTAQPAPLDQAAYEALTWVLVKNVGSVGETGSSTNILTYDTWDDDVVQKSKGQTNAGDPTVEVAYNPTDAGQIALRAAALTNHNYAFKVERNDAPTGGTPTTIYNRGLLSGPTTPNGRNEDFDLEVFQLALVQRQIKVPAAAGS